MAYSQIKARSLESAKNKASDENKKTRRMSDKMKLDDIKKGRPGKHIKFDYHLISTGRFLRKAEKNSNIYQFKITER